MYIPKYFAISAAEEISQFIKNNGFGQLISTAEGELCATHLPFLYEPDTNRLLGHIARANPQWKDLDNQQVLVILPGPHGYISPSWYTDPGVPTWNYQTVHITGKAQCTTEPDQLQKIVVELTRQYESGYESPWTPDFDKGILRGIVGIEIEIQGIQCKYKLSQNRSESERAQVAQQLYDAGNTDLATAMRELTR